MKRSGPLRRRTHLTGSLETHRAWQDRSRERQRSKPQRPRDTGPNQATRDRLAERSGLRCELCGRHLLPGVRQVHHRQPRGMGGDQRPEINALSCLLDLCLWCHGHIERERLWAKQRGLLVPRPLIPAAISVELRYGRVLLDDHGGYSPATTNGSEAA